MKVEERQRQASFSPDGRWVVYVSQKRPTGSFVTPFPSADREYKISVQGGYHPRWRAEDEIVFLSPDREMMSARVSGGLCSNTIFPCDCFRPRFRYATTGRMTSPGTGNDS